LALKVNHIFMKDLFVVDFRTGTDLSVK